MDLIGGYDSDDNEYPDRDSYDTSYDHLSLDDQAQTLLAVVGDSPQLQQLRDDVVTRLQTVIQSVWHGATAMAFGSSISGFWIAGSDIDLNIEVDAVALSKCQPPGYRATNKRAIEQGAMLAIIPVLAPLCSKMPDVILSARIPVLKLTDKVSGLQVDISLNNPDARTNSLLLAQVCHKDPRAQALGVLVKHWAKSRAICTPAQGTLSPYGHVLMVLFFLQQQTQSPLCSLETIASAPVSEIGTYSIVALMRAFMSFACIFNFRRHAISVRTARALVRKKHDSGEALQDRGGPMCVEDPLIEHDVGFVVDQAGFELLTSEWRRAADMLADGVSIRRICCERDTSYD